MQSLRAPLGFTARAALLLLIGAACSDKPVPSAPALSAAATASRVNDSEDDDDLDDNPGGSRNLRSGAVYLATDGAPNNEVVAYYRDSDGRLTEAGRFSTGGSGSGANLPGQGSVVLSGGASAEVAIGANRLLFVTNAGSNTLVVFRVEKSTLVLVSTASTGGDNGTGSRPVSVTVHQNLVYVVNQATANITGFWVTAQGELTPIPGSTRSLTGPFSNPAQVGFSPDGRFLVTEGRESQVIDVYTVDKNSGLVSGPRPNVFPVGLEPFSFTFDRKGHLFMTEGHIATPAAGTTSSYDIERGGALRPISANVPNFQSVPCWIVITENQKVIYESNALSSNISSYTVRSDGSIVLKESIAGVQGSTGGVDLALSKGSRYLYSLSGNPGIGTVVGFIVNSDETLTPLGIQATGLPPSVAGLAAR